MTNNRIIYAVLAVLWLPGITCAASLALCDAPAAGVPTTGIENHTALKQLIAEERASWNLAIKQDAGAYKSFHAPDFITVTGHGVVGKTASEASAMDAQVRFDQCELSGFDVRLVAQDAALVTYRVKAAGLDHGKAFHLESYASSLWTKRNGTWLNVFYQATPVSSQ